MQDEAKIRQEALGYFQQLIRLKTINPPGNEVIATDFISSILKKEGIEHQTVAPEPGRTSLVARLPAPKGSEGPLLLSSHLDVVPVEEDKWQVPPFEGKIADGYLWGRGTIDMKHMAVYSLMTLLLVKRLGLKLNRDLIWAAVADEEAGCDKGSRYLVEEHPDLIRAEYALNEVGGFTIYSGKKRFYPIQVAERGLVWFKIKAHGEAGHGSVPYGDSAVVKLAQAIQRLHEQFLPRHSHPVAEGFIRTLAGGLALPASLVLKMIARPYGDWLLKILPDRNTARFFVATLHNTAAPTMLEGGQKVNVIPSEVAVVVDGRILPEQSPESFLTEVKNRIGPGYTLEILKTTDANETPISTPLFQTLKSVLEERDPGSMAVPYLMTGFTDATYYQKLGIKTYGFAPIRLPEGLVFTKLFHNHNERIPVEGFYWGLETFFEAVRRFCEASTTA
ncbi:MAG: M20/M25/M40 family metallo-hydrolase [Deltaproteobacteria bacterium]|nr:M20/M25/M40 family metallo-hydrolase [Deltaproteobacteria bacterium]